MIGLGIWMRGVRIAPAADPIADVLAAFEAAILHLTESAQALKQRAEVVALQRQLDATAPKKTPACN